MRLVGGGSYMCKATHSSQEVLKELAFLIKQSSAVTGFGEVLIRTETMKQGKIRLFLQSGVCYRYVVAKDEFEKVLESLIGDTAE